eukprot:TRINITY_DN67692_c3_g11_i1.p1 TRINITY_DN67692_c3_g11~~TRINITY_DN67692_c3_g11_i1.p1  ORF type:complete len:111 (-),score=49.28 TRINITY_DN67692_c3_g11_i1:169-501(-)
MSSSSEISATLIAALKGENDGKEEQSENKLIVVDTSDGCGAKFLIYVVAEAPFQGKSTLERHRIVNSALAELLATRVHAVEIKAWTPEQYEKRKAKGSVPDEHLKLEQCF